MEFTITQQRMIGIFNEWIKRYSENPDLFAPLLDETGKPYEDYGVNSMFYFTQIANELDSENKLPKQQP